jgi:hypothetical protein
MPVRLSTPFSKITLHAETKEYFKNIAAKQDGGVMRLLKDYVETINDTDNTQVWRAVITLCEGISIRIEGVMKDAKRITDLIKE